MKYLVLIYHNPAARELWEQLPAETRAAGLAAYTDLNEDLDAAGERIESGPLAGPSRAVRVAVRDGRVSATDGPFAEVKEVLAGFYLLDCADLDRAIERAARIPEAGFGTVEIRPVIELADLA